jgi:hypothetical protein
VTVARNVGGQVGGIYAGGSLTLANSTISGDRGGGLVLTSASTLNNVTIADNDDAENRNVFRSGGAITARNLILVASLGANCNSSLGGTYLIETGGTCGTSQGAGNQLNTDPKLGPLRNNGGFAPTHALKKGSPAIDRGDDATCEAKDQRVLDRHDVPNVGTDICDVGAFEAQSP